MVSNFQRILTRVAAWILIVFSGAAFLISCGAWIYYGGRLWILSGMTDFAFAILGIVLLRFVKQVFK